VREGRVMRAVEVITQTITPTVQSITPSTHAVWRGGVGNKPRPCAAG
jgi:hypothetical protein